MVTVVVNSSVPLDIFFFLSVVEVGSRNGPLRQPIIICLSLSIPGSRLFLLSRISHQFDSSSKVTASTLETKREKKEKENVQEGTACDADWVNSWALYFSFFFFFFFLLFILSIETRCVRGEVKLYYGRPNKVHGKMKYDGLEIGSHAVHIFKRWKEAVESVLRLISAIPHRLSGRHGTACRIIAFARDLFQVDAHRPLTTTFVFSDSLSLLENSNWLETTL